MRRNENEKNNKRDAIISVGYDLFAKKGLEKTSVRDISTVADVNINTIYYYFRTKAEIVICCVEYGLNRIFSNIFSSCFCDNTDNINAETILSHSLALKEELCWCYQVIASPNYNWLVKDIISRIRNVFFQKIENAFSVKTEQLRNHIKIAVLIVKDYVITEDINCKDCFISVINQINCLIK